MVSFWILADFGQMGQIARQRGTISTSRHTGFSNAIVHGLHVPAATLILAPRPAPHSCAGHVVGTAEAEGLGRRTPYFFCLYGLRVVFISIRNGVPFSPKARRKRASRKRL